MSPPFSFSFPLKKYNDNDVVALLQEGVKSFWGNLEKLPLKDQPGRLSAVNDLLTNSLHSFNDPEAHFMIKQMIRRVQDKQLEFLSL